MSAKYQRPINLLLVFVMILSSLGSFFGPRQALAQEEETVESMTVTLSNSVGEVSAADAGSVCTISAYVRAYTSEPTLNIDFQWDKCSGLLEWSLSLGGISGSLQLNGSGSQRVFKRGDLIDGFDHGTNITLSSKFNGIQLPSVTTSRPNGSPTHLQIEVQQCEARFPYHVDPYAAIYRNGVEIDFIHMPGQDGVTKWFSFGTKDAKVIWRVQMYKDIERKQPKNSYEFGEYSNPCYTPEASLTGVVNCDAQNVSGFAAVPMVLKYQVNDGEWIEKNVEGNFDEKLPVTINGYGPHTVKVAAQLLHNGAILKEWSFNNTFTCGNPEVGSCTALKPINFTPEAVKVGDNLLMEIGFENLTPVSFGLSSNESEIAQFSSAQVNFMVANEGEFTLRGWVYSSEQGWITSESCVLKVKATTCKNCSVDVKFTENTPPASEEQVIEAWGSESTTVDQSGTMGQSAMATTQEMSWATIIPERIYGEGQHTLHIGFVEGKTTRDDNGIRHVTIMGGQAEVLVVPITWNEEEQAWEARFTLPCCTNFSAQEHDQEGRKLELGGIFVSPCLENNEHKQIVLRRYNGGLWVQVPHGQTDAKTSDLDNIARVSNIALAQAGFVCINNDACRALALAYRMSLYQLTNVPDIKMQSQEMIAAALCGRDLFWDPSSEFQDFPDWAPVIAKNTIQMRASVTSIEASMKTVPSIGSGAWVCNGPSGWQPPVIDQ